MSLHAYWPTEKHIEECIQQEAESKHDAVFLAVHHPVTFEVGDELKTEQEFLEAFITNQIDSKMLLMPVIGSSGVGKSHMIRWLHAQLSRLEKPETRHIIRIPKSSSLRKVVELILQGLEGEKYDKLREQLRTSRELDNKEALIERLFAEFIIVLKEIEENNTGGLRSNSQVYRLFEDPETKAVFRKESQQYIGIMSRLADRLLGTFSGDQPQFQEADLTSLEKINPIDLGKEARNARNRLLGKTNQKNREETLQLLNSNEVLDRALARLLPTGYSNLPELFKQIREELLREEKELILLVEDFAVLAGVQGALLDVMIQHAVHNGEQVLCTMRTALAVTEGYLINRDTVRTRATKEWKISQTQGLSSDQIQDRINAIVARYLNASRFGQDALIEFYKKNSEQDLYQWIPSFHEELEKSANLNDEEQEQLKAFGFESRYPLFPYNREAIRTMAVQHCTKYGELVLNPRFIINGILRPVLECRTQFIEGSFPRQSLHGFKVSDLGIDVRTWLYDHCSEKQREYMFPLVRYWGGNPISLPEMFLPSGIYQAFKLPPPEGLSVGNNAQHEHQSVASPEVSKKIQNTKKTLSSELLPAYQPWEIQNQKWEEDIKRWEQNIPLPHTEANLLRIWIWEEASSLVDWNALCRVPPRREQQKVFIPNVKGQTFPESKCILRLCSEQDYQDEHKRTNYARILRAIVRNHDIYESWEYEEASEDYALYMDFIRKQSECLQEAYAPQEQSVHPSIVQSLILSARVLHLEGAHESSVSALVHAMLSEVPEPTHPLSRDASEWLKVVYDAKMLHSSKGLLLDVLEAIGARQGGGEKVHALHVAEILKELELDKAASSLPDEPPSRDSLRKPEAHYHMMRFCKLFKDALDEEKERLKQWESLMLNAFGKEFNKKAVCDEFRKTLDEISPSGFGVFGSGRTETDLRRALNKFEASPFQKTLSQVQEFLEDPTKGYGPMLACLSKIDQKTIDGCSEFHEIYSFFLAKTKARVGNLLEGIDDNIVAATISDIQKELEQLEEWLGQEMSMKPAQGVGEQ